MAHALSRSGLVAVILFERHSQAMAFASLSRPQPSAEPDEKYPALRAILLISKLVVVLFAFATIVAAYLVWQSPDPNKFALGLLALLSGTMICLIEWAGIEAVEVLLDIEENTRRTADRERPGTP